MVRVLVAAVLCLWLVAGCSDGETVRPAPLPTESETETVEPTPPVFPDAAHDKTTPAIEAFLRYWVDVFNYASSTGDTAELRRISSPRCGSCVNLADRIDEIYEAGGRTEGRGWSIQELRVVDPGHISASVKVWPQIAQVSASATPVSAPATRLDLSIGLDIVRGDWVILFLDQE